MQAFEVVAEAVYVEATDELVPAEATLLERSSGGVLVELMLAQGAEMPYVLVTIAGESRRADVAPHELMDAYWHPFSSYVEPFGGITRESARAAELAEDRAAAEAEAESC